MLVLVIANIGLRGVRREGRGGRGTLKAGKLRILSSSSPSGSSRATLELGIVMVVVFAVSFCLAPAALTLESGVLDAVGIFVKYRAFVNGL